MSEIESVLQQQYAGGDLDVTVLPAEFLIGSGWPIFHRPTLIPCLWTAGEAWFDPDGQNEEMVVPLPDLAGKWRQIIMRPS